MVNPKFTQQAKDKTNKFILPITKLIACTKIQPWFLTLLSFICGLLSIYFLFINGFLFILFSLLAILFDILDGNLARYLNKTSKIGFYLDQGNDRLMNLLMLLKYNIIFNQYWIVLPLFIINYAIFFIFKTEKVIYTRAFLVISFIIAVFWKQAYSISIIISIALLMLGIILQILELVKKYTKNQLKSGLIKGIKTHNKKKK